MLHIKVKHESLLDACTVEGTLTEVEEMIPQPKKGSYGRSGVERGLNLSADFLKVTLLQQLSRISTISSEIRILSHCSLWSVPPWLNTKESPNMQPANPGPGGGGSTRPTENQLPTPRTLRGHSEEVTCLALLSDLAHASGTHPRFGFLNMLTIVF